MRNIHHLELHVDDWKQGSVRSNRDEYWPRLGSRALKQSWSGKARRQTPCN